MATHGRRPLDLWGEASDLQDLLKKFIARKRKPPRLKRRTSLELALLEGASCYIDSMESIAIELAEGALYQDSLEAGEDDDEIIEDYPVMEIYALESKVTDLKDLIEKTIQMVDGYETRKLKRKPRRTKGQ
jgi:hypothetical protein